MRMWIRRLGRLGLVGVLGIGLLLAAAAVAVEPFTYPLGNTPGYCFNGCCYFSGLGDPNGTTVGQQACDEYKRLDTPLRPAPVYDFQGTPGQSTGWVQRPVDPYCGDGVWSSARGEQCDDGVAGVCQSAGDCRLPNADSDPANDCTCATATQCGNGQLDPGEACDPPGSRSASGQLCTAACRYTCDCLNGIVETGCDGKPDETCDVTAATSTNGTAGGFSGGVVEFGDLSKVEFAANASFTIKIDFCVTALPTSGYGNLAYKGGTSVPTLGYQMVVRSTGAVLVSESDGSASGLAQSAAGVVAPGNCYTLAVSRLPSSSTHTAFLRNRTTGSSYTDVFAGADASALSTALTGSASFSIGRRQASSSTAEAFFGQIDNVSVWDDALTETELEALEGVAIACNATTPATVLFLATFNEGTGATVADCADDAGSAFTTSTGTITTSTGGFAWEVATIGGGAGGEVMIGACNPATQTCNRTTCGCETSSAGASCGNGMIEAGEQCDDPAGGTGGCGPCASQTNDQCCQTDALNGGADDCQCAALGGGAGTPPARTIHTSLIWTCLQNCPPVSATCTDGVSTSGVPECCASCAPATMPALASTAPILNLDLANSSLSRLATARELLTVSGAVAGKQVEVYTDSTRSNTTELTTFGDGRLRNKFVLGFQACSGDWSYECTTNADCTAINPAWTCQSIGPNLGVFLRRLSDNAFSGDASGGGYCSFASFNANGTATTTTCLHVFYDLLHPHFRDVWVAHVLQHARQKSCTGCADPGEQSPVGPLVSTASCVAACGAGSVAVPSGVTRVFYDNVGDPEGDGTSQGFLPPQGSANAVRDPDPSRCDTSVTPPVCHDGDTTYDRDEYVRDMKTWVADVTTRINDGGMSSSLNILGKYFTLQTNPRMRDVVRTYAATERRPKIELEIAVFDFGTNSLREGPISSGLDLEEALDAARWLTGTTADPTSNPSPSVPLVIEEPRATRSARHREANLAFALLVTGDTSDTASGGRSQWTTAAHLGGNQWFDSWDSAIRNWYTSTLVGVNLLGRPTADWVCAGGASPSASDSGTFTLTGLPNCGVYRRSFPNGTVFFNAKVTAACADTDVQNGTLSCAGSVCTHSNACTGTTFTSIDLDDTNGMPTTGNACLLRGDGTRQNVTLSTSSTLELDPLGAAIFYHGTCP